MARWPGDEGCRVGERGDQGQSTTADGERGGEFGVEATAFGDAAAVADLEEADVVVDDDGDVDDAVGIGVQHRVGARLADQYGEVVTGVLGDIGEAQQGGEDVAGAGHRRRLPWK